MSRRAERAVLQNPEPTIAFRMRPPHPLPFTPPPLPSPSPQQHHTLSSIAQHFNLCFQRTDRLYHQRGFIEAKLLEWHLNPRKLLFYMKCSCNSDILPVFSSLFLPTLLWRQNYWWYLIKYKLAICDQDKTRTHTDTLKLSFNGRISLPFVFHLG